jgi:hypothetical protein
MNEYWINFTAVIIIQFLLFLAHAWYEGRLREVPRILAISIAIGVPFGIAFDLVVGKVLSVYDYHLGFGLLFLTINGALSFGLMQANTLLVKQASFLHFYIWTIYIGLAYEIANVLFPVWIWGSFAPLPLRLFIVHVLGYTALALLIGLAWHITTKHKFVIITNLLNRKLFS